MDRASPSTPKRIGTFMALVSNILEGITVLNTPGTIDADYRGELKIILINHSKENFVIKNGERIAQMVVCPVIQAKLEEVEELSNTDRGSGGFGSTGIK